MTPLAVTDRLFFEHAETGFDREQAERTVARALAAATMASCSSNIGRARRSHSRRAGSVAPDSTLLSGSASEPWRTKRRVTPMRQSSRTRRSGGPPRVSGRSLRGIRGPIAEAPRATNARLYSDANPLAAMEFSARTSCWPRSTLMRGARIRAWSRSWPRSAESGRPSNPACRRCARRGSAPARAAQRRRRGRVGRTPGDGQLWDGRTLRLRTRCRRGCLARRRRRSSAAVTGQRRQPARPGRGDGSRYSGPGWPGILLHEAIGHGLEGDFNRKKTSAFAGLLGTADRRRGGDCGGRRHSSRPSRQSDGG